MLQSAEIVKFLKSSVEPLQDSIYGEIYRAAAYLLDGTYLPCVIFQSQRTRIDLFHRRMKQLRWQRSEKEMVIESFLTGGSSVAYYHLKSVETSPFAWPGSILRMIDGETRMSWTAFVVEMKDGTMYQYGATFTTEFFDLPAGYSHSDIAKIHSGMSYTAGRGLHEFSLASLENTTLYREKPYFTCYLAELD